ncbi:hypothetical protein CEXT_729401 [Caerostris extrusa]|uniref:Uncharacterized protein n=1 Tax=Caerostris extrusa TaxID=172846 RepID=A0AAV4M2U0_CAEEX|nr:hypothetical protein CEXT_729401 [Caerostris extrusa]
MPISQSFGAKIRSVLELMVNHGGQQCTISFFKDLIARATDQTGSPRKQLIPSRVGETLSPSFAKGRDIGTSGSEYWSKSENTPGGFGTAGFVMERTEKLFASRKHL